jgi:hypothetical protein
MKKTFALATLLAGLAAAGCTTMNPTTPDRKYQADQPPPIAKGGAAGQTELAPVKLPIARTNVSADNIDDTNVNDQVRKLESELKVEKRAVSQAK